MSGLNILVPLDGSQQAELALAYLAAPCRSLSSAPGQSPTGPPASILPGRPDERQRERSLPTPGKVRSLVFVSLPTCAVSFMYYKYR